MEFKKYQHLERFGTTEVQEIQLGKMYVFPKIDGTNSSVWLNDDGDVQAGSRKRHLSLDSDNAGFYEWAINQESIFGYLKENPTHRLFGEWLVPHSLKTYKENAWRNFYVFDVAIDKTEDEMLHQQDSEIEYLSYEVYEPLLKLHNIEYIPPICTITNAGYEQIINQLMKNVYLIEDGKGNGEGIVLKNYEYKNKYNRQTWAKIVTSEFKEKHAKEMGASDLKGKKMVEIEICDKYVTKALCEKVYSKIDNESGFTQKNIPQLLNTVYYDVVKEECWNFVKEHKNPTINFKTLQHFVFNKVKEQLPNIF